MIRYVCPRSGESQPCPFRDGQGTRCRVEAPHRREELVPKGVNPPRCEYHNERMVVA